MAAHPVPRARLPEPDPDDPVAPVRLRQLPRRPDRNRGHLALRGRAARGRVRPRSGDHPRHARALRLRARRVRLRADGSRRERERHAGHGHEPERHGAGRCLFDLQLPGRVCGERERDARRRQRDAHVRRRERRVLRDRTERSRFRVRPPRRDDASRLYAEQPVQPPDRGWELDGRPRDRRPDDAGGSRLSDHARYARRRRVTDRRLGHHSRFGGERTGGRVARGGVGERADRGAGPRRRDRGLGVVAEGAAGGRERLREQGRRAVASHHSGWGR